MKKEIPELPEVFKCNCCKRESFKKGNFKKFKKMSRSTLINDFERLICKVCLKQLNKNITDE